MKAQKILLIEDNPEMRENTAEILSLADYQVITAENGKIGVALARSERPDLIICDVMMPELDGFGVLRMLGKHTDTAAIPFIFLTAKAEKSDFRKGMSLGADDYLTKPFDDVELLDAIEMRLKKNQILQTEFSNTSEGLSNFLNEARTHEALEKLSEERETRVFRARDIIFQEETYPQALYLLVKGKVKTYKTNEEAKEYITGLFKPGDYIGYLPLLRGTHHTDSAMALDESEVVVIPRDDFFQLMFNNRDVSHKFIKMLSDNLSEKEEELLHLAYDSVRKRVADALIQLMRTFHAEGSKTPFSMSVTRDNLASLVGTSKECVIRVLSEFKEEGILETKMSEITILQPEKLSKVRY